MRRTAVITLALFMALPAAVAAADSPYELIHAPDGSIRVEKTRLARLRESTCRVLTGTLRFSGDLVGPISRDTRNALDRAAASACADLVPWATTFETLRRSGHRLGDHGPLPTQPRF